MKFMHADKIAGNLSNMMEGDSTTLNEPNVVVMKFSPEDVVRFERVGNTLILHLRDGRTFTVVNFFDRYQTEEGEERNEIVFQDENGVTWWGQYTDDWCHFQIAEIDQEMVAAAPMSPLALAGILPLAGLGLMAGGGNRPPSLTDVLSSVSEAGISAGGNSPFDDTPEVQGNVLSGATDADGDVLAVTQIVGEAGTFGPGDTIPGTYGSLVMQADGSWVYTLDNDREETRELNDGDTREEVFTFTVDDGNGGVVESTLTISVEGTNDQPIISGDDAGAVTEDSAVPAEGQLQVADPDAGDTHTWSVEGPGAAYGTLTVDADGKWTYVLDNSNPDVQALNEGVVMQDVIRVRVTDSKGGWTEQEITIDITGVADTPEIDPASDLSGEVTETPNNTGETLRTGGELTLNDPDSEGELSVTVTPDDGGYLGDLTLSPVVDGRVNWEFTVDDDLLNNLPEGEVLTQEYTVTVTDAEGNETTETITVKLNGTNDRPEAQDDESYTTANTPVTMDVLDNDSDVDTGDKDRMTVSEVDGQPIAPGDTVTLSDGSGTVTMGPDGNLTFDPAPGFTGKVTIPYTADDGSGTPTSEATADWVVTVVGVDITDTAGPDGPQDGTLSTVDDLEHTLINGVVPNGGTITGLTVTDENGNTVTIPAGSITVNPDGTFTTTADVTGLDDGTLTVTLEVEDSSGNPTTLTDTIEKDTVTSVTIDPLVITDGQVPEITGTGVPGETVTLTIDGTDVEVTVAPDGTWSYTPPNPLNTSEVEITASTVDPFGNTATDTRKVAGLSAPDVTVDEAGLNDPLDPSESETSTLTIDSGEGAFQQIEIAGTVITEAELQNIATTPIAPINTQYGVLTVTGYDPATGVVTYDYEITAATQDHNTPGTDNVVSEELPLTVVDQDGDKRITNVTLSVTDDAPVAVDDAAGLAADDFTPLSGNVLNNDDPGADGGATVTPQTVAGTYGTLTLNADGSYTYVRNPGTPGGVSDVFNYTMQDADGDTSTATLTIGIGNSPVSLGGLNGDSGSSDVVVNESALADGSDPSSDTESASDTFTFTAPDGVAALQLTQGGVSHDLVTNGTAVTTPIVITTALGNTLTITDIDMATGTVSYTYDLNDAEDHPAGEDNLLENFGITLTDGDGDTTNGTLGVRIADDVPEAADDTGSLGPNDFTPLNGNVLTNDEAGADGGATVTPQTITGTYGTLTLNADGSYTYVRNPGTPGGVSDVFNYTMQDADGDTSTATLTIDIGDSPVSLGGLGDDAGGNGSSDVVVNESALADGSDPSSNTEEASDTFTFSAPDGVAALKLTQGADSWDLVTDGTAVTTPIVITTALGNTLTITDIDMATGTVSYTYDLNDAEDHPAGEDNLLENFGIVLEDEDGDIANGTLGVRITDDAPVAVDQAPQTLVEGGNTVGTAQGAANLLDGDTPGADGARVHEVRYTDEAGVQQTATVPAGGNTGPLDTQHGTLTVNSDGTWTFVSDPNSNHPPTDSVSDDFEYNLIDGDGDESNWATQPITITDTEPSLDILESATVSETNLPTGTDPDAAALKATGSLNLEPGADDFDTKLTLPTQALTLENGTVTVEYELSPDGHTVTAYAGPGRTDSDRVYELSLTDPTDANAGYEFELFKPLDHGPQDQIGLDFEATTTDADGDYDSGYFTVTVTDDAPVADLTPMLDEDGSVTLNISADATQADIAISTPPANGTVTINPDGTVTYTPNPNFSGTDTFTVTTDQGTTTVTATVNPISDAPDISVDSPNIVTPEDTPVALGLNAPVITDTNGPRTERIGPITLSGFPEGAELLDGSGNVLAIADALGEITVIINDVATLSGVSADRSMSSAEFEALQVRPPAHRHENFTVEMEVTSYEVDAAGNQLAGVPGATSNTAVNVDVQAVTDDVELTFDTNTSPAAIGADAVTYPDNKTANVTFKEDTAINLKEVLKANFEDLDGSENRDIVVTNNTGETIVVAGHTVADGASYTIPNLGLSTSADLTDSDIFISGPLNFSGDLNGITVALTAKDTDGDSTVTTTTETDSVTLNLRVTPVAGDVAAGNVETDEDTAVAFLENVHVTDTGTGTETIDSVTFTVDGGWELTGQPPAGPNFSVTQVGDEYTVTFTGGTEAEREALLDQFEITPPAHSSLDKDFAVSVVTTDVNGTDTDTKTTPLNVKVTVNPVAEEIGIGQDSDGNGTPDLTMNPDHQYTTPGEENVWYTLGTDGAFDLQDGWSNEDTSEQTFALITPTFVEGEDGGTAVGTKFQWVDSNGDTQTAAYGGAPVEVPMEALSTLKFMAPLDVAGRFSFEVKAKTVDVDEDTGDTTESIAITGGANLTMISVLPTASDPVLRMNGRAIGYEDTHIPIALSPASSDPNETFNVRISDIPAGAKIFYDGNEITVPASGEITIPNFDAALPLDILPPPQSNVTMNLQVAVQTEETATINGTTHTVTSAFTAPAPLSIQVKGLADAVTINPKADVEYDEAGLDAGTDSVMLSDLIDGPIVKVDDDGSEVMTLRVSGLPEGFVLQGGAMLTGSATGVDRVWSVTEAQLAAAKIAVPDNFSGEVNFTVAGVTTENDGDSATGADVPLSFKVNPSPEATVMTDIEIVEDVPTPLNLAIVHQNGDTDETISAVRIAVDEAATSTYTLYVNDGGTLVPLSSLPVVNGYHELTPAQAANLEMQTAEHLDGPMAPLNLEYKITDNAYQGNANGLPAVESDWQTHTVNVTATPVTDDIDHTTESVDGAAATTSVVGTHATLDAADTVTVRTKVTSPDHDGSEHIVRVLIENVPVGVFVEGGQPVSATSWLLVMDGTDAIAIDDAGGEYLDINFVVSTDAVGVNGEEITINALVQDDGNEASSEAEVKGDETSWTLTTTFSGTVPGEDPAVINTWEYTGASTNEDESFALSDMINAGVTSQSTNPNTLSIKITGFPEDTEIDGMVKTVIDGEAVWTASVTTAAGDTPAQVQAKLDNLMDNIIVTPPEHANDDNAAPFAINAVLSATVEGGVYPHEADFDATIPVNPITDPATLTIGVGPADADGVIKESEQDIPIRISVTNPEDDPNATVIDGKLYVQLSSAEGLEAGTLTDGTNTYTLENVSGVPGVPDGDYYVIENVDIGDDVDLTFTPDNMTSGTLTVSSTIQNKETGAANTETVTVSEDIEVELDNNGVTIVANGATGNEAWNSYPESAIEIEGLSVTLNDPDSEEINAILLTGVPSGFLVFTGDNAGNATASELSNNAGGGALNTWVLSGDGEALPNYIAILPPRGWSGTLSNMEVVAISGETGLDFDRTDAAPLGDFVVNPRADGVIAADSTSFGNENEIVPLNLSVVMYNPGDGSVAGAPDQNNETATITLSGVGPNAAFFIGNTEITDGITYDAGTGDYTIEGLSQENLDALGVRQEIANYDDGTPADGIEIGFSVVTVEHSVADGSVTSAPSAPSTGTVTLTIEPQLATNGDDNLIWTGDVIDGLDGDDTVSLQPGDSLTGAQLMAGLENIETLDLGVNGANNITDLSAQNVRFMTDGDNELTINGTGDDQITLTNEWTDNGGGNYSAVINQGFITTTVNLTINGGVGVTVLPQAPAPAPIVSGAGQRSFGLRSLDAMDEPEAKAEEADIGNLTLGDVLSQPSGASLGGLLSDAQGPIEAPIASGAAEATNAAELVSPWDDDLSGNPVSEF